MFKKTAELPIPAIWFYTFSTAECDTPKSCWYYDTGLTNLPFSSIDKLQFDEILQSYPKSAYDFTNYIDFTDQFKPKWDNSRPFKVSFKYICTDHFGKTFDKILAIQVKCKPDSKTIGSPPEDAADGAQDDVIRITKPI